MALTHSSSRCLLGSASLARLLLFRPWPSSPPNKPEHRLDSEALGPGTAFGVGKGDQLTQEGNSLPGQNALLHRLPETQIP